MNPITEAAKKIRLLILDVDGVLTDGKLYYSDNGSEAKAFNIQDGLGVKLLQRNGIEVGIITGRSSALLTRRTDELGINLVMQGREDKLVALKELIADRGYRLDEIAYAGDDLPDLAAISQVGLGIAVANASEHVAKHAVWTTTAAGGHGAVREIAEEILAAQGKLQSTIADYLPS